MRLIFYFWPRTVRLIKKPNPFMFTTNKFTTLFKMIVGYESTMVSAVAVTIFPASWCTGDLLAPFDTLVWEVK